MSAPRQQQVVPATSATNRFATASVILGLSWLFGFGAVLAIALGAIARYEIAETGGAQKGRGIATAGMLLGIVGLGVAALLTVAWMTHAPFRDPADPGL